MNEAAEILTSGFWIDAFGVNLSVQADSPTLLDLTWEKVRVAGWLRLDQSPERSADLTIRLFGPASRVDGRFGVEVNGAVRRNFVDAESAADLCRTELHLGLAQLSKNFLFVHAGVVRYRSRALLFPGFSNSGKSNLIKSLVSLGCKYLSDEYAVFTREGLICGFPRPLRLRQPNWEVISPEILGWKSSANPLKVGGVFSLVYQPNAAWSIDPLSQGLTVLELFSHTVDALARGGSALSWLQRGCATSIHCWKGIRGEALEAAQHVLETVNSKGRRRDS